jgi:hypothetical protein
MGESMADREPRHTVCGKVRAEAGVVLKLRFFGMPIQGGRTVDPGGHGTEIC